MSIGIEVKVFPTFYLVEDKRRISLVDSYLQVFSE